MQERYTTVSGLYIHWPFCPYRCFFCPFVALAGQDEFMASYNRALVQEVELFFERQPLKDPIETIFVGGGTPSTWPNEMLLDTFGILNSAVTFAAQHEITLEVNPGTVTSEKIDTWESAGITRISMGVQSLNEKVLATLNRHHTVQDVQRFLEELSQRFRSLSVDLILGLPGVTPDEWRETIRRITAWPIHHISVYFLTVHEDTRLYYGVQQQQFVLPTDDVMVDMYLWTVEQLEAAGFEQYEISNFAKPGHRSRHNQLYWNRDSYKGFGLGACSFNGLVRTQNEKNLMKYIEMSEHNTSPVVQTELLTESQVQLEKIMLGIRQNRGISREALYAYYGEPLDIEKKKNSIDVTIDELVSAKLLAIRDGNIALTARGRAVENEIIIRLTRA